MKKCSKCDKDKSLSEFSKSIKKKDGYNSYCKECNKTYQKNHYQDNKSYYFDKTKQRRKVSKEFIDLIKINNKCLKCSEDDIACLDFHHVDEDKDKDFNISEAYRHGVSIETIKREIDKCIILCSNCHRKLHYYENKK